MDLNNQVDSRLANFIMHEVEFPKRTRLIERLESQFGDIVIDVGIV